MAEESQQKRLRSEEFESSNTSKRQKPYTDILSLLDDDEDDDLGCDLSAIFATLQQELSSAGFDSPPLAEEEDRKADGGADEDVRSVMRHLLEASDDELGIPNPEAANGNGEIRCCEGFDFSVDDGIWELHDVAANYFA